MNKCKVINVEILILILTWVIVAPQKKYSPIIGVDRNVTMIEIYYVNVCSSVIFRNDDIIFGTTIQ